jgi:hypothetical protein
MVAVLEKKNKISVFNCLQDLRLNVSVWGLRAPAVRNKVTVTHKFGNLRERDTT